MANLKSGDKKIWMMYLKSIYPCLHQFLTNITFQRKSKRSLNSTRWVLFVFDLDMILTNCLQQVRPDRGGECRPRLWRLWTIVMFLWLEAVIQLKMILRTVLWKMEMRRLWMNYLNLLNSIWFRDMNGTLINHVLSYFIIDYS